MRLKQMRNYTDLELKTKTEAFNRNKLCIKAYLATSLRHL